MKDKYSKKIEFKNHKLGLYDLKTFVKDWENEPKRGIAEKRCRIVKKGREKVLEITIPKNTISNGGSFWRLNFPRNFTEATFEYEIMFGDNFDFVRGGKLPGLGGGVSMGSGGTAEQYQNGFSARLMWRELDFEKELTITEAFRKKIKLIKEIIKSEDNSKNRKEKFDKLEIGKEKDKLGWLLRDLNKEPHKAYLVQYLYYPDRKTHRGDDQIYKYNNNRIFIEPSKWYTIKNKIKLSEDPKKKDRVIAWVNGKKVLDKKISLRNKKSYGINQIMFSLFFGGEDETFQASKNEKVYFRKFEVNGK